MFLAWLNLDIETKYVYFTSVFFIKIVTYSLFTIYIQISEFTQKNPWLEESRAKQDTISSMYCAKWRLLCFIFDYLFRAECSFHSGTGYNLYWRLYTSGLLLFMRIISEWQYYRAPITKSKGAGPVAVRTGPKHEITMNI